jgi:hypothetical protein
VIGAAADLVAFDAERQRNRRAVFELGNAGWQPRQGKARLTRTLVGLFEQCGDQPNLFLDANSCDLVLQPEHH